MGENNKSGLELGGGGETKLSKNDRLGQCEFLAA